MKTHTSHTPGPLSYLPPIGPGDHGVMSNHVNASGTFYVATCHMAGDAARIVACVNACENLADPGAVPDLLDALKSALDIMEGREAGSERVDAIAQARSAIARATGEKGGK